MTKKELKKAIEEKVKKTGGIPKKRLRGASERKFRDCSSQMFQDAVTELVVEGKIFRIENAFGRKFLVPSSERGLSAVSSYDDKTPRVSLIREGGDNRGGRDDSSSQGIKNIYLRDNICHSSGGFSLTPARMVREVERFTEEMNMKQFFQYCTEWSICCRLGVAKDELDKAKQTLPELGRALKKWEAKRNALFMNLSVQMAPGTFIFLSKNFLGFKEKLEHAHGGSEELPPIKFTRVKDNKKKRKKKK